MSRLYHITFHAKIHRCSLASFLQKYHIASARSSAPVEKKNAVHIFGVTLTFITVVVNKRINRVLKRSILCQYKQLKPRSDLSIFYNP